MPRGGKREGSGGKPGVPHKVTGGLRLDLLETLRSKGYDPAVKLIETREEALAQYQKRLGESAKGFGSVGLLNLVRECDTDLMEYVYPKLARTEHTGKMADALLTTLTAIYKSRVDNVKP